MAAARQALIESLTRAPVVIHKGGYNDDWGGNTDIILDNVSMDLGTPLLEDASLTIVGERAAPGVLAGLDIGNRGIRSSKGTHGLSPLPTKNE